MSCLAVVSANCRHANLKLLRKLYSSPELHVHATTAGRKGHLALFDVDFGGLCDGVTALGLSDIVRNCHLSDENGPTLKLRCRMDAFSSQDFINECPEEIPASVAFRRECLKVWLIRRSPPVIGAAELPWLPLPEMTRDCHD
jgi:hypothetical protein